MQLHIQELLENPKPEHALVQRFYLVSGAQMDGSEGRFFMQPYEVKKMLVGLAKTETGVELLIGALLDGHTDEQVRELVKNQADIPF